ncbi:NAD-dependent epimerase/dehydratase family protein [Paludicola sp. MB14-C6]|uniref:NAD-dependent epimerase/dehydratase family protein n=1 Tax=Paludihabitans sp. MB14-C6 TaxID=3070656 RepID=UPI0027DB0DEF|nr:NAD-dependent epimerase/dehydratase family protein [Paludicola sp. MB14-C6]WMJ22461.1 NAD-dependent epimerase/dehydratase family protein [Paludicola sp. MB14-C6]
MNKIYIVTGAFGHLGNTIVRKLVALGETVRGLVLPNETSPALEGYNVEVVKGNVCDINSMEPLFACEEPTEFYVIHTAGIVSISSRYLQKVYDVNVNGTKNIIELCKRNHVKRFVHVSSVHAIPEPDNNQTIHEINQFNEKSVVGLYAKTKAIATQLVLDSVKDGLDAVIVHPSGIIGPNDYGHAHLTQLIMDYLDGRLTACVKGGYDFVDVRDVADGIISACHNGEKGECYILSNRYCSIPDLLNNLHQISGKKKIKTILPLWIAKATAPLSEIYYKLKKQPPLYTSYSLHTLKSNANFTHKKANRQLGYQPRDLKLTLKDTVDWLRINRRVKA